MALRGVRRVLYGREKVKPKSGLKSSCTAQSRYGQLGVM